MKTLRYFSTFTGIGGLDWGLEKLGARCVGFSEIKKTSISIYGRHYPDHKNFGDITKIVPKDLPDFDVFTGGFPCQSFSMAGVRKGFGDRRGQMIFHIYDILTEKKPEFVVLENVKGITTHNRGKTYQSVFKLLSAAGYHVRVVLLNSAHYGSAQARERMVFLCRRGKDFPQKNPEVRDDTKRFRDIRDNDVGAYEMIHVTQGLKDKMEGKKKLSRKKKKILNFSYQRIGGYDRVGTLTTGKGGGDRAVQMGDGWRYMTILEGERAQNFPEGWTLGESESDRWFAIGNAVSCATSEYLFTDYLKGLWW